MATWPSATLPCFPRCEACVWATGVQRTLCKGVSHAGSHCHQPPCFLCCCVILCLHFQYHILDALYTELQLMPYHILL